MTPDRLPTKRQEWAEISRETQSNVDERLDRLRVEIDAGNQYIAATFEQSPDAATEYANQLVDYLNEEWKYATDLFFVSGKWDESQINVSADGIEVSYARKDAFGVGYSNGFTMKAIETDAGEMPVVGMSFAGAPIQVIHPHYVGTFHALTFAHPHEISLSYMRPGGEEVVSSDLEEIDFALQRASSLLDLYLNSEDSKFYQQSAKKQQTFLRSIIDSVEAVLPAPDSFDKFLLNEAQVEAVSFKSDDLKELYTVESINDDNLIVISGEVIGVTLLDVAQASEGRQYRSPSELKAAEAGLCLIVRPSDMNFDSQQYKGNDLIVPLRKISSYDMSMA